MIQYRNWGIEIGKYQEKILVGKEKPTGFIYLPGSKFCEAEGNLTTSSCLQDAIINSAPRIGKYTNKLELYRQ